MWFNWSMMFVIINKTSWGKKETPRKPVTLSHLLLTFFFSHYFQIFSLLTHNFHFNFKHTVFKYIFYLLYSRGWLTGFTYRCYQNNWIIKWWQFYRLMIIGNKSNFIRLLFLEILFHNIMTAWNLNWEVPDRVLQVFKVILC